MLPVIYLIIILAYALLAIGFTFENKIILILSSFLMFFISISVWVDGLDTFNNFLTVGFGAINFGVAAYIGTRSGIELIDAE